MGYTRYWTRTDKLITNEFISAINSILSDCRTRGITIKGGNGDGNPTITDDAVVFNGDGSRDLDHETFYITNNENELNDWQFCKTAEKPYDYAVKRALEEAERLGLVEGVSDDGSVVEMSDDEYLNKYAKTF